MVGPVSVVDPVQCDCPAAATETCAVTDPSAFAVVRTATPPAALVKVEPGASTTLVSVPVVGVGSRSRLPPSALVFSTRRP